MFLIFTRLFFFLLVIFSFGSIISQIILKEKRISVLAPFSILIGLGGYMFFVNAFSYFIPIKWTIWLVLLFYVSFVVYQVSTKGIKQFRPIFDFSNRKLYILFGLALLISSVSALVQLRSFDPDFRSHLIAASTISEGNFPVMSPMNPDFRLPYHYGPDLLSGATHNVTQIPLLQNYEIQIFFFGGATFLLAFIIAFYISGSFSVSLLASLFFIYGGGFLFLNIFNGFSPLYHKYILGEDVVGAWKFIADMVIPKLNHFYVYGIRSLTTAMGTPIMLAVIYLYFIFIDEDSSQIKSGIITGLILGSMALSLDTSFVILSFVLALDLARRIYLYIKTTNSVLKQQSFGAIKFLVTVLVVGSITASLQGGLITNLLFDGRVINSGPSFTINKSPWLIPTLGLQLGNTPMEYARVFSATFFKEFGLLLILFISSLFVYWRDKRILFLSAIGITAFILPFTVVYVFTPGAMLRLFSISTPIFSFISAFLIFYLARKYKKHKGIRLGLVTVSLMVVYGGVAFQLACMVTPWSDFGNIKATLIANYPKSSDIDLELFDWVEKNTNNTDRFFPYNEPLIINTGRMSPGNYWALFPIDKIPVYDAIVDSCAADSLREFKINYILLSPGGFSSVDFIKKCTEIEATSVFRIDSDSDYREIYQLKK